MAITMLDLIAPLFAFSPGETAKRAVMLPGAASTNATTIALVISPSFLPTNPPAAEFEPTMTNPAATD